MVASTKQTTLKGFPGGGFVTVETVGDEWTTTGWNMLAFTVGTLAQPDKRTNLVPALWQAMAADPDYREMVDWGVVTLAGGCDSQPHRPTSLLVLGAVDVDFRYVITLLLPLLVRVYARWYGQHRKASQPDATTRDDA